MTITGASLRVADRANRYSCAAARSFGLGGGAAWGAAPTVASGAITAPLGCATGALAAFTFLAGRVDWGLFAGGAATFFCGAAATFLAGAAFDDGFCAAGFFGAALVAPLTGALALAAGAFFKAGFDDGFFAAGFFAAGFFATGFFGAALVVAFFATGLAGLRVGDFFAAAMVCLPRPALVVGGFISVRGTLPCP
ncbi:MAG: hypothetical protein ACM3O5_06975 [Betaproteobacteria bacterium]